VKGQLHAPATLFLGKMFPDFSAEEAGWAPEPKKENFAASAKHRNTICVLYSRQSSHYTDYVIPSKINTYFIPNPVQQS
jgi:hypothetical protein